MKQMEYTIKVTTNVPVEPSLLAGAMKDIAGVESALVTNWRVLPTKKAKS
jgi:hypothetical protein